MKQPWAAELSLSPRRAQELIEEHTELPKVRSIRLAGEGWDNWLYEVNQRYLFRFPRRHVAVEALEREVRYLPQLNQAMNGQSVQIPHPLWPVRSGPEVQTPFYGYRKINGRPLEELGRRKTDRARAAAELALFLGCLHQLEPCADVPVDPWRRLDINHRLEKTVPQIRRAKQRGEALPFCAIWELVDQVQRLAPFSPDRKLVHGDLHFRHLLLDQYSRLRGIIDWGDLQINDPAVDLQIVLSAFTPEERAPFFERYAPGMTSRQELLARWVGVWLNLSLMEYAANCGLTNVIHEARDSICRALQ